MRFCIFYRRIISSEAYFRLNLMQFERKLWSHTIKSVHLEKRNEKVFCPENAKS
jgi:hypothetical protein